MYAPGVRPLSAWEKSASPAVHVPAVGAVRLSHQFPVWPESVSVAAVSLSLLAVSGVCVNATEPVANADEIAQPLALYALYAYVSPAVRSLTLAVAPEEALTQLSMVGAMRFTDHAPVCPGSASAADVLPVLLATSGVCVNVAEAISFAVAQPEPEWAV